VYSRNLPLRPASVCSRERGECPDAGCGSTTTRTALRTVDACSCADEGPLCVLEEAVAEVEEHTDGEEEREDDGWMETDEDRHGDGELKDEEVVETNDWWEVTSAPLHGVLCPACASVCRFAGREGSELDVPVDVDVDVDADEDVNVDCDEDMDEDTGVTADGDEDARAADGEEEEADDEIGE
jgi:hypothetical protein